MKHAIRYITLVLAAALLLAGCSKKNIIPDSDLEKITKEMFVVNAYAANQQLNTDSLDIYTPILNRYGYTHEDFFNTLANFQKRKSARVSDVVEAAIASLEGLSSGYELKLRNLAFVDSVAKADCSREVLFVERIKVRSFKDTARLRLSLPIADEGEYIVSYRYEIDTLDKNRRLQTSHSVYDADGVRNHLIRNNLQSDKRTGYRTTITPKKGSSEYRLLLADYAHREEEPHITFDSIRIVYLPSSEVALARMDSLLRFRPGIIFNDSIRARGYLDARIPMLPHDTIYLAVDSIDLALADALRAEADSLTERADESTKKAAQLRKESDRLRTAAERKWFRNDSLRQVAHLVNVAKADSLDRVAATEVAESDNLLNLRAIRTAKADSLDRVVLGYERTAEVETNKQ